MNEFWQELFRDVNDWSLALRVLVKLGVAALFGGILGLERLQEGKAAGLRTLMLVALGSALFTLIPVEAKMSSADVSRVIQGVAAGIGFLGAGTILKLSEEHRIEGLTSAASIWLTAAAGAALGAGWLWPAVISFLLGWFVLNVLNHLEHRWTRKPDKP